MDKIQQMPTDMESNLNQSTACHTGSDKDTCKRLSLSAQHLRLTQVVLQDQTDSHNELVTERHWLLHPSEQELCLSGNLFIINDLLTESGWILVKQALLPHATPETYTTDLRVQQRKGAGYDFAMLGPAVNPVRKSTLTRGIKPRVLEKRNNPVASHGAFSNGVNKGQNPWVVLEYHGGCFERTQTLHEWQNGLCPSVQSHRIPLFFTNTWGDRSCDSRIGHDFVQDEIQAARRLCADVIQIDDGWQLGITSNSAYSNELGGVRDGFWNKNPNFWQPHPERFSHGLAPIVASAGSAGLEVGLWFATDPWNDSTNWEKDANRILELFRTHNIKYFKIDSVKADTLTAQKNIQRFFNTILDESNNEIVLDLDTTAQGRLDHFSAIPFGTLFVENRYTDWHNYWPHHTLRNLWKLSWWIDPRRLRMEFLNNARNTEKYKDDPLSPCHYSPDTLFATVMFSNPLGWFEVSHLPQSYFETVPPLVRVWKKHREQLFAGAIAPIGEEPDGISWTGFISVSANREQGYCLVFRELNAMNRTVLQIPKITTGTYKCELLGGKGKCELAENALRVEISEPLGYIFFRFFRIE